MKVLKSFILLLPVAGFALPSLPQVEQGGASIKQPDSHTWHIHVKDQTLLNYEKFNIQENEKVRFIQPDSSSVVLNRVIGSDSSHILGSLESNGSLFLINPQGIIFGSKCRVQTGSFIASVLNIQDNDFAEKRYHFKLENRDSTSAILNQGYLQSSSHGQVVLMAPSIQNQGLIQANIACLGAEIVSLDFTGDGKLKFALEGDLKNATIEQAGELLASKGEIYLQTKTAKAVVMNVVNTDGIAQGQYVLKQKGLVKIVENSLMTAQTVKIISDAIDVAGDIKPDFTKTGTLYLQALSGAIDIHSAIGLDQLYSSISIEAESIDQIQPLQAFDTIKLIGRSTLRADMSSVEGSILLDGPVTLANSLSISGNQGICFNGSLNAETKDINTSLILSTAQGEVNFKKAIGNEKPLFDLTIANTSKLSMGDLNLAGSSYIAVEKSIDLMGSTYKAAEQSWSAPLIHLTQGGDVNFITSGRPLEIHNGVLALKSIDRLNMQTDGGLLKVLSLEGAAGQTVVLDAGAGQLSIGNVYGNIKHLSLSGKQIDLMQEIQASHIQLEATHSIGSTAKNGVLIAQDSLFLNVIEGDLGSLDHPIQINSQGKIVVGSLGGTYITGSCPGYVVSDVTSNPAPFIFFNQIEWIRDEMGFNLYFVGQAKSLNPELWVHKKALFDKLPLFCKKKNAFFYLADSKKRI